MKFYFAFMLAGFVLCSLLLFTDEPGSGMGWGMGLFAALGAGVALYNKLRYGSVFNDGPQ